MAASRRGDSDLFLISTDRERKKSSGRRRNGVVAQLVERSLAIPEDRDLNPVIGKIYILMLPRLIMSIKLSCFVLAYF